MVGIFNHELFVLKRRLRSARPSPFSRFVLFLSSRVRRYRLTPSFLQLPPKISVGANYKTSSTLPVLAGLSARRLAKARPSPTSKSGCGSRRSGSWVSPSPRRESPSGSRRCLPAAAAGVAAGAAAVGSRIPSWLGRLSKVGNFAKRRVSCALESLPYSGHFISALLRAALTRRGRAGGRCRASSRSRPRPSRT